MIIGYGIRYSILGFVYEASTFCNFPLRFILTRSLMSPISVFASSSFRDVSRSFCLVVDRLFFRA